MTPEECYRMPTRFHDWKEGEPVTYWDIQCGGIWKLDDEPAMEDGKRYCRHCGGEIIK